MKYALRGITAEELSYSMNRIKMDPNTRFEIKPQFSRTIKQVKENENASTCTAEGSYDNVVYCTVCDAEL